MGTIVSATILYSIAYAIVYLSVILTWYLLGLPIGPGTPITYP